MGPCAEWTARYYYDNDQGRCVHFWYGGCHGNSNKFLTRQECQSYCQSETTRPSGGSGGSGGRTRDMSHVFTVPTGSSGGAGAGSSSSNVPNRFGSSAASSASRARVHLRPRRPAPSRSPTYPDTHAQHMMPAAR